MRNKEKVDYFNKERRNMGYKEDFKFSENVRATDDIEEALKDSTLIICCLPT